MFMHEMEYALSYIEKNESDFLKVSDRDFHFIPRYSYRN
jgi:hypothetical protein